MYDPLRGLESYTQGPRPLVSKTFEQTGYRESGPHLTDLP